MPSIEVLPILSTNPDSQKLSKMASKATSESGEDGILSYLFDLIGTQTSWCAELGSGNGKRASNISNLLRVYGWSGLQIERKPENYAALRKAFDGVPGARQVCRAVGFEFGVDGLDDVLTEICAPRQFDLLSITVRSCTWHFWDSVIDFAPRVVAIRHNPTIPIDVDFVQDCDMSIKQGCSLAALVRLARLKQYELAAVTSAHAIFVTRSEFDALGIADNSISAMWKGAPGRIFCGYDLKFYHTMGRIPWLKSDLPADVFQLTKSPVAKEIVPPPVSGGKRRYLNRATVVSTAGLAVHRENRWTLKARKQNDPWFLFSLETVNVLNYAELDFGKWVERPSPAFASFSEDGITWKNVPHAARGRRWYLSVNEKVRLFCLGSGLIT
ncbi:MAG: hypothetical protein ACKVP5_19905 [Aestuariivirga sp.]